MSGSTMVYESDLLPRLATFCILGLLQMSSLRVAVESQVGTKFRSACILRNFKTCIPRGQCCSA